MSASEIRKTMDVMAEAPAAPAQKVEKNVKVNLETLARSTPSKGKYNFNKGFLTFQDMMDDPNPFLTKYRKEKAVDTTKLITYLSGMKPLEKYTDKSHYLRIGYEARGFGNSNTILVWWKEKSENLLIFTGSKDAHVEIRDFLQFFRIIQ